MSLQEIISEVKTLSVDEQKQLAKTLVDILAEPREAVKGTHSLRELRGLGKELWSGIDAQAYIDQQRDEWDNQT